VNKTLLGFAAGATAITVARSSRVRAAAHCLRGRPTMFRMQLEFAGPLTKVSPGSHITECQFTLPPSEDAAVVGLRHGGHVVQPATISGNAVHDRSDSSATVAEG
jgi:hypothetical protein